MSDGRDTGDGYVQAEFLDGNATSEAFIYATFWNYNINGEILKDYHEMWLYIYGLDLMKTGEWDVTIDGFASRSGNADYNMDLSMRRGVNMRTYLKLVGVPFKVMHGTAWGSIISEQMGDGMEDDYDRCVTLTIRRNAKGSAGPEFQQLAGMWQLDPGREISEAAYEMRNKD